ncbi:MAG TPA: glycoside hydrolase family 3 C-terminal domain-containing protein [Bryobacteraceae bacterium]|nr:glycoside hydrolase family 3 C-terminal domain-containing protein [Bryobacteraceae bacterium]
MRTIILAGVLVAACAWAQQPAYLNPSLPIDQRADDLIGRMTLEEKASQLVNQSREIPRLNVPKYDWWSEALHGVAFGIATVFPEPIGLAASFDTPLIHDMAIVIGTEARAKHNMAVRAGRRSIMEGLDFWSPNLNIFRDPRWGRGQETYGEDPYLTGRMGVAYVTGMQGDDLKYLRVISTPKHYAVHSGPEPARHTIDVKVSKHDEEDTYLPGFRAAVVEGKAWSVMCVYNSVNGQPGCANDFLLKDQLRDKWKFDGYVVSDCGAVTDILSGHRYVKTAAESAAVAVKAGMDNECIDFFAPVKDNSDYVKYIDAVKQGLLTEKEIDVTVKRLIMARMALGMFDPPEMVKYAQTPDSENDSEPHRQLALKAARETMTLLKNDGTLPLKASVKKIAVVGPLADQIRPLEGNYNGTPSRATTVLDGIRKQFANAQVTFEPGTNFLRPQVPVPPEAFTTDDGKPGLKVEFFKSGKIEGAPDLTRTDEDLNMDFTHPGMPAGFTTAAARWTGWVTAPESGTWEITLNGARNHMYLDGKMVIDGSDSEWPQRKTITLTLKKGEKHAIKVDEAWPMGLFHTLTWRQQIPDALQRAVAAAKKADVTIAVVGITSDLEGEEMKVDLPGFKGGDRTSLELPQEEEDLIKAVHATKKPLVVTLMSGSALSVNWAAENANSILQAWYSGEEGGAAVAETLAGVNNPAGRLPVTFYKSVDQLPDFTDYSMANRTYRYFTGNPLYPFGFGLSYSKFEYGRVKLSTASLKAGDPLILEADVKNTSGPAGDEVVQVYLSFPKLPGAPLRALRAFQRVHVGAGETQHVKFALEPRDLSMVNETGDRLVAAGAYKISVGGGQPGTSAPVATTDFTITGEEKLPE